MSHAAMNRAVMNRAVVLIGHGSLRSASGASMIRIAARLREEGIAPIVEPAFLNFSRPTFADAVARALAAGATEIVVQPYFLIDGAYVRNDVQRLVAETARTTATEAVGVQFQIAPAFGHHPAMVDLAYRRMCEAAPALLAPSQGVEESEQWGLLLMAHGTPLVEANQPLYAILDDLLARTGIRLGTAAFLDCNTPDILNGAAELAHTGATHIIALPYFLHLGRHVREDLPRLLAQAQAARPQVRIISAQHLDYDLGLVQVVTDRSQAAEMLL